jgi:alkylhydroperoxidase family enzyme
MPFLKSLSENAGPPAIFEKYPDISGPWSEMSQVLMNGPSPLSPAERELILAFAAGTAGCTFVYVAHSEVAYRWGVEEGLLDRLIENFDSAPVEERLRPLLAFVRKLILSPKELTQADTDAVLSAGWDERALHDTIAITGRASFMQRLVKGYGFVPMSKEAARKRAEKRVRLGYVNLCGAFSKKGDDPGPQQTQM